MICKYCNTEIIESYNSKSICKSCHNKRSILWTKSNPEKVKKHRRKQRLKEKYGITIEQYEKLKQQQKDVCALCQKEHTRRHLNVDHCHKTGRIRGLLCDKCNLAIGLLDDNPELFLKIKDYLCEY